MKKNPVKKSTSTVRKRVRRRIDPTTCERDYTYDEVEFMNALSQYKTQTGRMFPTCGEILEVVRSLGYRKQEITSPVCEEKASAL